MEYTKEATRQARDKKSKRKPTTLEEANPTLSQNPQSAKDNQQPHKTGVETPVLLPFPRIVHGALL